MFKKFIAAFIALTMLLTCCINVAAATIPSSRIIKVTISMGVGEQRDLSTYMKSTATKVSWTSSKSGVLKISGNTIQGESVGATLVKGVSGGYGYIFTVKVLGNYSGSAIESTKKVSENTVELKDGTKVTYVTYNIKMGTNDVLNITGLLKNYYYDYNWSYSNSKLATCKKGVISTSKYQGLMKITATSNSSKEKNKIYRFYVSVDNSYIAKNIIVSKETKRSMDQYVGNGAGYVFTKLGNTGASSEIRDGYLTTPKSAGTTVFTAESTTGGANYTLIFTTTGNKK